MDITKDILLLNGFEEHPYPSCLHAPASYSIDTGDAPSMHIIIEDWSDNRYTNSGEGWVVHVDNNRYEKIGYAELSTIEQFNKFMEVFRSCFRLDPDV